jgi:GT2 family glycosyltransferase
MAGILIQCVVVLYKQRPEQAQSLSSLLRICEQDPSIARKISIFVQDNSPESQLPASKGIPVNVDYHHEPTNPGLAAAYNNALQAGKDRQAEWLLLLDQDTAVDRDFLLRLLTAVNGELSQRACAIVPKLVKGDLVLSPNIVGKVAYRPVSASLAGFSVQPLVAFNSATCLRIQPLEAIGGFPREYWLDYLDHIVFHRLQAAGGRVYVLDSRLEHSLSLRNIESEVSVQRYANILSAEWRFIRDTGEVGGPLVHRLRLLRRALSQAIKLNNKTYAWSTFKVAWQKS